MRMMTSVGVLACVLLTAPVAQAADQSDLVTPNAERAVNHALRYLEETQNADGSWGSSAHGRHPAVTALACLAFMAQGNLPGRGRYGRAVERGIQFLVTQVHPETGYIGGSHGRMYGHGFATLALAEAYGMMPDPDLKRALERAIRCIKQSQKSDGGWRYDPSPAGSSDLSVTVCQVMALRSANNAGIKVPRETIDRAIEYTKHSANADGSFRYMLRSGSSSFALTAAGVTTLFGAGYHDADQVKNGVEYLKRYMSGDRHRRRMSHYFYAHYYAVQAMYQAGGADWDLYYPKIRDDLVESQLDNGSWQSNVGNTYGAAMGALVLQVPYNYLPIFQR